MRLENVVALTYGKVVNNPFVTIFEDIVLDAKSVKRGDLFIAFCEEEIETAILNGAYGIVFDKPTQITDSEIAWIKVENLDEAIKKLIRFKIVELKIVAFHCNEVTLQIAKQINTGSAFTVIDEDIKSSFKTLWNLPLKGNVIFSNELTCSDIFADVKELPKYEKKLVKIVEQTLFETSFIYDGVFYERQPLSPLFLDNLLNILTLLTNLKIGFRLKKINIQNHFEALFINKKLQIKDFGSTQMVVIFEKDIRLFQKEIEFLEKNASWGKTIYLVPKIFKTISKNYFLYEKDEDIFNLLKNEEYNFALVFDKDKSILNNIKTTNQQPTLF